MCWNSCAIVLRKGISICVNCCQHVANVVDLYGFFHIGCQFGSASPWRVGTCRWESPSFLLAEFWCCRSKNRETVRLRQRLTNVQPMRKTLISSSTWNYVLTRKQQNTLQLTTIKKIAVVVFFCLYNNFTIVAALSRTCCSMVVEWFPLY